MKAFHSGGFDEMNKPLEGVKAARDSTGLTGGWALRAIRGEIGLGRLDHLLTLRKR